MGVDSGSVVPPAWQSRYAVYAKAVATLKEYAAKPAYSGIERAGLVKHFELTFELAWKTLKDFMGEKGVDVNNPRDTIKLAWQEELIEDFEGWSAILRNRNLFAHVYDESQAEEAIRKIKVEYLSLVTALDRALMKRVKNK